MKRLSFITLAAALVANALGQAALSSEVLYHPGEKAADQGLLLRGWGSGTISQTDETSFDGAFSIQVSTRNFFQGGIMSFGKPFDLAGKYENKDNLLKVTFLTADSTTRSFGGSRGGPGFPGGGPGGGVPGGGRPGQGGFPGGGRPGQGFPGGGPGQGFPGGGPGQGFPGGGPGQGFPGGGPGQGFPGGGRPGQGFPGGGPGQGFPGSGGPGAGFPGAGAQSAPAPMKTVRIVVTTTDDKRSEAYVPVNTSTSTDRNWKIFAIPLKAISGFDRTNKVVKSISFSGDGTATFYIGDLRVVNDSTPIHGEIENQEHNFALGDNVTFHAMGSGGASVLKYSWDFGASTGVAEDATGQVVTRKFRKAGKYHITLTISDMYGLKPPFSTAVDVVVND